MKKILSVALLLGVLCISFPSLAQEEGVHRSPQSVKKITSLAEQGDANAQVELARIYAIGEGVPQSYQVAHDWLKKAAAQNNADAQRYIGVMYLFGQGDVPKNHKEALKWMTKAAKQGHAEAQHNVGAVNASFEKNYKEAYIWFRLAEKQGFQKAKGDIKKIIKALSENDIKEAEKTVDAYYKKYVVPFRK